MKKLWILLEDQNDKVKVQTSESTNENAFMLHSLLIHVLSEFSSIWFTPCDASITMCTCVFLATGLNFNFRLVLVSSGHFSFYYS